MRKIGILGGAFNPPHIGHLIIAEEVKEGLNLDEVWFIPTYTSPHKEQSKITTDHRIQMLEKSIEGNRAFSINLDEIDRKGTSYTIDTIKKLTNDYPTYNFYFIIGADMVEYLPKWKDIDQLVSLVTFVGVHRRDFDLSSTYPIKTIDIPTIEISSTDIRNRIKRGKSIKYLVLNPVYDYIKGNQLYED